MNISNLKFKISLFLCSLSFVLFSTSILAQSSANFKLNDYGFGGGGETGVSSTNYGVNGIAGEVAGQVSSSNYGVNSGLTFLQNANTPAAPTLVNSANWYNKLKITINPGSTEDQTNGTTFAIAISTDNFASDIRYVQDNNTVASTLGIEDYQDYSTWGGSGGSFIIGLTPGTTYYVKVKALQGKYTDSPYSAIATASTANPSLSFDIDVAATNTETSAPYDLPFGDLSIGSVNTPTSNKKVWIDLDTNAEYGGYIYLYDQYGGLRSTAANYTIAASSTDLTSASEGMGIQGIDTDLSQSSGGPMMLISPYDNSSGHNVGIISSTIRELFASSSNPIVNGRGSFYVKVKPSNSTPTSNDYTDILTLVASSGF